MLAFAAVRTATRARMATLARYDHLSMGRLYTILPRVVFVVSPPQEGLDGCGRACSRDLGGPVFRNGITAMVWVRAAVAVVELALRFRICTAAVRRLCPGDRRHVHGVRPMPLAWHMQHG